LWTPEEKKRDKSQKKKDGDLLAQAGDDSPLWNLSFCLKN